MEYSVSTVNSTLNESLHLKMKILIMEINKYLTVKTEDSLFLINRHLQALSVTIDINVFDPDTNLGTQFFISLYNLFMKTEPTSQMSWYCVDVLCNICRNSSARRVLIETYNFIPCLSQLLSDHLTDVKKKKLLKLMQTLSCGIKISWQIPHLPHLFKTLTRWVESTDEELVCLSLGVLVNLCYNNLSAVYTLSKSVDLKKLLKFCLQLKGPIIDIHVCKLTVALDYMHTDFPKDIIMRLIQPTFLSIFESFKNNDVIILRQSVDFFLDAVRQNDAKQVLREYTQYENLVEHILQLVDTNVGNSSGDSGYSMRDNNPECISVILEFIHSLLTFDAQSLSTLNFRITNLAINWINSEVVSFQALAIVTKVVETALETENDERNLEILQALLTSLPVFCLILQSNATPCDMESCRRLGAVLRLFRAMLRSAGIRQSVMQVLNEDLIAKVFVPLQTDNLNVEYLPIFKVNDAGLSSTDAVETYLCALSLVNDVTQYGANWLGLQGALMENRKIHMIIAHALLGGNIEIKTMALEISRNPKLPIQKVASVMGNLQPIFSAFETTKVEKCNDIGFPVVSYAQLERLDDTLDRLKNFMDKGNPANIATSQVMELYEYKLVTLGYAEKSALNSIEAATEKCTQLQHRMTQITAELNKLQQLLLHEQYCLEQTMKSNEEFKELYIKEQNRALAALGKVKMYEGQIVTKDEALKEFETRVKECNNQIEHMTDTISKLRDQVAKNEQVINKLVESGNKSEKNLQKAENLLKTVNLENKNLNSHILELEQKLNIKEGRIADLTEQYKQIKQILDTITKVATSSQVP